MSDNVESQTAADQSRALVRHHPPQPLMRDPHGVVRFKENKIVSFLVASGSFSMNTIARMDFSDDDRSQLAQLIGYSVSGFGELSYISDEEYARVVPLDKGL